MGLESTVRYVSLVTALRINAELQKRVCICQLIIATITAKYSRLN